MAAAAELEAAMVVMVRPAAAPANPNMRPQMRDAALPGPKVPILVVGDKAIADALAAAKTRATRTDGYRARRRACAHTPQDS